MIEMNNTKSSYHQIQNEGDKQQNRITNLHQGVATEEFPSQEANTVESNYFTTQESLACDENLTINQKNYENSIFFIIINKPT